MIKTYHRPIDPKDIQAMQKGKGSLSQNLLMLTFPIGVILFLSFYWMTGIILVGMLVAVLFVSVSAWSNVKFFKTLGDRGKSKDDQASVEVVEVEAIRVLDIEPLGSHGPAYCFFAQEGNALLLVGQWLMGIPKFPSLSFRVLRWADTREPIRIEVTGKKIKAAHSTVGLRVGYSNGDIEIFKATPDSLQQDLEKAFGKRAS